MSLPKKEPKPNLLDHADVLSRIFGQFTSEEMRNMTMEEYTRLRKQDPYGYQQFGYQFGRSGPAYHGSSHLTEETVQEAMEALAHGRQEKSFISQEVENRIRDWCHTDSRVGQFWTHVIGRIRKGLNDEIVDGMFQALSHLLRTVDAEYAREMERLNTRNLDNIRSLGTAAHSVVSAFEEAVARGDTAYMEAAVEELDAALYEVKFGKDTDGA